MKRTFFGVGLLVVLMGIGVCAMKVSSQESKTKEIDFSKPYATDQRRSIPPVHRRKRRRPFQPPSPVTKPDLDQQRRAALVTTAALETPLVAPPPPKLPIQDYFKELDRLAKDKKAIEKVEQGVIVQLGKAIQEQETHLQQQVKELAILKDRWRALARPNQDKKCTQAPSDNSALRSPSITTSRSPRAI